MYVHMQGETCGSHSDVTDFRSLVCHQGKTETRQVTHKCWYMSTKVHTAKDSKQRAQIVL